MTTTIPASEADDMQALALRAIGYFSQVQDSIDDAVRMLCEQRMNRGGSVIGEFVASRIRDSDRVGMLMAIAGEVESDASLENFKEVFNRAKTLRDNLAHSSAFRTSDGADRLDIGRAGLVLPKKKRPVVDHVDRSELNDILWDCSWMYAQVMYVGAACPNPVFKFHVGSQAATFFKPTASPEEWDGNVAGIAMDNE